MKFNSFFRNFRGGVKFTYSLLFMTNFAACLWGQNQYSSFTPPSPTATSLGKYGDIPVNLANGTPNINIPLYTLKSRELSMDISLSYHAGGIKLDELPSWVGMGWSLNAGGVITRKQNDAPDEVLLNGWLNTSYSNALHDCMDNSNPNCPFPDCISSFFHNNIAGTCTPTYADISDNEPDEFFYNFEGYTGKFIFGEDGLPLCVPKNNLKIEWTKQHQAGSMMLINFINQFIVTTPNGTKYIFGMHKYKDGEIRDNREVTGKYAVDDNDYPDGIVNSWYLCAVVKDKNFIAYNANLVSYDDEQNYSLNSDVIELFYEDENALLRYRNALSRLAQTCQNTLNGSTEEINDIPTSLPPIFFNITKRLQKIVSDEYSVIFSPPEQGGEYLFYKSTDIATGNTILNTQNPKRLGKIEVKNANGISQLSYVLGYNDSWNVNKYRLYLTSITSKGINLAEKPPYLFDYYNISVLPDPIWLLGKIDGAFIGTSQLKGIDHWGFYNGVNNNFYGFPEASIAIPFSYTVQGDATNSRESNEDAMKAGVLTKITYPTGGYTEFVFEGNRIGWVSIPTITGYVPMSKYEGQKNPNDLNVLTNQGILVGGLRIKEIIDCSIGDCNIGSSSKIIKKYSYEQAYRYQNNSYQVSSGVLGGMPLSAYAEIYQVYSKTKPNNIFLECIKFQITSQALLPVISTHGSHVSYQKVTETHYNANDYGKTDYFFTTALPKKNIFMTTLNITCSRVCKKQIVME